MPLPNHEHNAAALHDCTRRVSHPDSEEAVQIECQRVAQELEPFGHRIESRTTLRTPNQHQDGSARPHQTSKSSSTASNAPLRDCTLPEGSIATQLHPSQSRTSSIREVRWYSHLMKFWTTHVSVTIDGGAHRDHLALERTFLGYLRTSLILVITGVMIAQLFRIQHTEHPNPKIGFHVIGRPLSVSFIGMAVFVLLVGAIRFYRLQHALVRGKALMGGWEIFVIMALSALLLVATFALVLAVNIDKAG